MLKADLLQFTFAIHYKLIAAVVLNEIAVELVTTGGMVFLLRLSRARI